MRRYPPHNAHISSWSSASPSSSSHRFLSRLRLHSLLILPLIPSIRLPTLPVRPLSYISHIHTLPLLRSLRRHLSLSSPLLSAQLFSLHLLIQPQPPLPLYYHVCPFCASTLHHPNPSPTLTAPPPKHSWLAIFASFFFCLPVIPFMVLRLIQRILKTLGETVERGRIMMGAVVMMGKADTYTDWVATAKIRDQISGVDKGVVEGLCEKCAPIWNGRVHVNARKRRADRCVKAIEAVCDLDLLAAKTEELVVLYRRGDVRGLAFALRPALVRNFAGICAGGVHQGRWMGTSKVVEDFVNVVAFLLAYVAVSETKDAWGLEEKVAFLNEARHAYGKTALMLSGGASMGLIHLGVVKALLGQRLLPKVVCGTSAGALVASIVGIFDDQELEKMLMDDNVNGNMINPRTGIPFSFKAFDEHTTWRRRARRFLRKGFIQDVKMLQDCLRKNYGDVTFEEAYLRTRRILNITVCPSRSSSDPPMLLNYLTAPHVLIWSAASASCALPYVFAPVELVSKSANGRLVPYHPDGVRWIDGSISSDVPLSRIGELFNVNHFIVSQTNPHVIPRAMPMLQTRVALLIKSELQFRYWQMLQMGFVPKLVSSVFPHFMQPYAGDVTIMPDVWISDLFKLLKNPTVDSLRGFVKRGERTCFPHLDRIRSHCLIEQTLDKSVEFVASGGGTGGSADIDENEDDGLFGRVPSWLWLDTRSILKGGVKSLRSAQRTVLESRDEVEQDQEQEGEKENFSNDLEFEETLNEILRELEEETLAGNAIVDPTEYRFHGLSDTSEDSGEEDRVIC